MTPISVPANPAPPTMQRVRFVSKGEAVPGMTLAFAIHSVHHNQLFKLAAGSVLSQETIDQLRSHQVNCFAIVVAETRSIEEISAQLIGSQAAIQSALRLLDSSSGTSGAFYASLMEYRLCFS